MAQVPTFPADEKGRPTPEDIRRIIDDATRLDHFFVSASCRLIREFQPGEEILWEIFRGHLLGARQTRLRQTFDAWNLFWQDEAGKSEEPILAVKLDSASGKLYVTRGLLLYVTEPYDAGCNVIETRRATRWNRELVGEVDFGSLTMGQLREEIARLIFRAVVGLSRLPLTSVEAPLPGFSLGRMAYFFREQRTEPIPNHRLRDLIRTALVPQLHRLGQVKLLEFVVRSVRLNEIADMAGLFAERWLGVGNDFASLLRLLLDVFVETALSPYTDFVDNSLAFAQALVDKRYFTAADQADFLGALLRQIGRHLTAYDLITFHHSGANYPDALLLDSVLKSCLYQAETHPELWLTEAAGDDPRKCRNRRGLRQGWLLRRFYEGHPVPDAPTSPGENARVLPAPYTPVPDEQIIMPHRRRKRLFESDPLARHVGQNSLRILRQSVEDLCHTRELRELGMALFLDRPLGVAKGPLQPDQTLLLSYEAFSRSLAEKRLVQLARDPVLGPNADTVEALRMALQELPCEGVLVPSVPNRSRPVVSLQDSFKVAGDFVVVRTTRTTVRDFLDQYDLRALNARSNLDYLVSDMPVVLLGGTNERGETVLTVFDSRMRRRLEMKVCGENGYFTHRGVEFPRGGLQALRIWEGEPAEESDLSGERVSIEPRR